MNEQQFKGFSFSNFISDPEVKRIIAEIQKQSQLINQDISHLRDIVSEKKKNASHIVNGNDVTLNSDSFGGTLGSTSQSAFDAIASAYSAQKEPTGFENRTGSAWTFTDATLKLAVTVVSGSYNIWFSGAKLTITTTKEITIADTEGIHAIYFDTDGILKEYVNPSLAEYLVAMTTKCLVAILYWDATNKASVYVGEERHGCSMDGITHYYLHYTSGLQVVSGLTLSGFVIGDGSLNTHAQFAFDTGSVSDEDIGLTISAINSTTGVPILYKLGANSYWRKLTQTGYSCYQNPSGATNRLMYNQLTGGAWQLTEVGEGNYVLYHIYATSGKTTMLYSVMGTTEYTTLPSARAGAASEIANISLGSLPSPEMHPVATIIYQTDKDYGNDINARVIQPDTSSNYISWVTTPLPRGTSPTDHQALAGLLLAASGVTWGHIDDQAQTIAGVKTFSGQIISSLADGTKPFDVTSTTKCTNLNADKVDGYNINESGASDGEIIGIDTTNKELETTGKTIVTTLGTTDLTVPTSKAVNDKLTASNLKTVISGGMGYALYTMSADQTTNIAANNHIQFDEVNIDGQNSLMSCSTGSGQAKGIITLIAGYKYRIMANVGSSGFSGTAGYVYFRVYNRSGSAYVGSVGTNKTATNTSNEARSGSCMAFIAVGASNIDIEVRFQYVNQFSGLYDYAAKAVWVSVETII